ncbi:HET-domain-containing protein [Apiospora kogelbergensis]|uniref:HET-domain-containing protein n=1 Tax=Apiospora kogelbergensis TaxID=1337665 RepID=A0AAW0QJ11_9PEZI
MSSRVWVQIRDSLNPKDTIIAFYHYLKTGRQQRITFVPPKILGTVEENHYRHDPLPNDSDDLCVRLLELLPSSEAGADVQCRLTQHRHADCQGEYETLSYVWGDTKEPVPITIDGRYFFISQSLYQALVDLRHENKLRRIWVDAVCIDQMNIEERSQQVSAMGQIYKGAKRVVIYLGAAYPKLTKQAYTLIERCATEALRVDADLTKPMTLSSLSQGSQIKHGITEEEVSSLNVTSLRHLGGASWWARSWTAQEVLLARDALVVTGTHTMEWKRFCSGVDFGLHGDIIDVVVAGIMIDKIIQPYLSLHTLRMELRKSEGEEVGEDIAAGDDITAVAAQSLLALLVHCRFRKATDRRDKVYAFLGLKDIGNPGPPTALGIQPDYTATDVEVYRNAAQKIILHSRGLEILGACLPQEVPGTGAATASTSTSNSMMKNMPTWVPDWSNTGAAPRPLMYDTFGARRSSHAASPLPKTATPLRAPTFADNGRTLVLSGHHVATIEALSPVFRRPELTIDENGWTSWLGQSFFVRLFTVLFYVPITAVELWLFYRELRNTIVNHLGLLAEMESFARRVSPTNLVTAPDTAAAKDPAARRGEEPIRGDEVGEQEETGEGEEEGEDDDDDDDDENTMYVYRRTLCAGAEAAGGPGETKKLFQAWRDMLAPLFAMHARGVDRWFPGRVLYKYMRTTWKGFSVFTLYLEMAYERRLARGSNGYLLLVPGHAEVGDRVVIVKEGRVPLVLRPKEEGVEGPGAYSVVGEAYGEGIMNGEAFREQDCAEIRVH